MFDAFEFLQDLLPFVGRDAFASSSTCMEGFRGLGNFNVYGSVVRAVFKRVFNHVSPGEGHGIGIAFDESHGFFGGFQFDGSVPERSCLLPFDGFVDDVLRIKRFAVHGLARNQSIALQDVFDALGKSAHPALASAYSSRLVASSHSALSESMANCVPAMGVFNSWVTASKK